jgi:DNA polymerase III alpha subunit
MPLPILASPLTMIKPTTHGIKLKGSSSFLIAVRNYLEKNIKKRMSLIIEAWELSKNVVYFGSRAHAFHEYLQDNFKNEEGFYTNVVLSFGIKVSNMTKLKRREEYMPSPSQIKQLNACWKEKIKNLRNIVQECNEVIVKREELFRRLT